MKFIAKECPKCHGPIEDQSRFCSHCGTAVLLDDEATSSKYTYQKVDDARIREADVKETIRLKELEIEQAKLLDDINHRKQWMQLKLTLVLSFFIMLLILVLLSTFNEDGMASSLAFFLLLVMCIVFPFAFRNPK